MSKVRRFPSKAGKVLLSAVIAASLMFGTCNTTVEATNYSQAAVETNKQAIYNYLVSKAGYNSAVACGIMANIQNESGFLPNNVGDAWERSHGYTDETFTAAVDNGTISRSDLAHNGTGYGLCQWTWYTCKEELYDLAKSRGTSIGDLETQLIYLVSAIKSTGTDKYLATCSNDAQGAYLAGYYFCKYLERPSNIEGSSVTRGNLAKNTYWPVYGNKAVTSTPTTTTTTTTEAVVVTTTTEASTVTTTEAPAAAGTAGETTETAAAGETTLVTPSSDSDYTPGKWKVMTAMMVRSAANADSQEVGILKEGAEIEVSSVDNHFGQIVFEGKAAWVSLRYAAKITVNAAETATAADTQTASDAVVMVNATPAASVQTSAEGYSTGTYRLDTAMYIRSESNADSTAVTYIGEGATIIVTGVDGHFGQFNYKGTNYWVSLRYSTKIG